MVKRLNVEEAQSLLAAGAIDLVDVRAPHEFAAGHLPGARLVPLDDFRANPAAAKLGARVLFVCAGGTRSLAAAQIADANGVAETFSLDGGTRGWAASGLPVVTEKT